jgi:MFS transporter, DHA1 family, inner membrane transport protein
MGFFKNKTFNLIYGHATLQAVAMHGGEAFAFVYLLKAGIAVPVVLLCIGLMFGSRVIFRQAVLPVAKRIGLRQALILGILVEASTYPLLAHVTDVGPMLLAYLTLWAISSSFYWTTYHAYVALIGDSEHAGAQTGVLSFIGAIIGIVAPLASGFMLVYFGPGVTFTIIGLAMAAAAIPIAYGPNLQVLPHAVVPWEAKKIAVLALFSDGIRSGSFHFTWLIALFITLNANFAAFGGTLALAGIVGAVVGLVIGKSIDVGGGKRALLIGVSALAVAIVMRAFGYNAVWSAVLANAAAAVVWPAYDTMFGARVYNLSRQSPCPLRFHIAAEGGWDAGTALGCLVSAAAIYAGFSFFWPLLFALVGCALLYAVLAPGFDAENVHTSIG